MFPSERQAQNRQDIAVFIPESVVKEAIEELNTEHFVISQAGFFERAFNHYIKRSGIDEHVIIYCTGGSGFIRTDTDYFKCKTGDLIFCRIHSFHEYGADNDDPWTIHWFHIKGSGMNYFAEILGLTVEQPLINIGTDSAWINLLREIHDQFRAGYTKEKLIECSIRLQYFLISCKKSPAVSGQTQDAIARSRKYIAENIDHTMNIDKLAQTAGVSRFHFIRLFKQKTGYTPLEYINRLKIQKACDMLLTRDIRMGEISDSLGFSSPFYFSTVFKRIIGCSPRDYKKRYCTFR